METRRSFAKTGSGQTGEDTSRETAGIVLFCSVLFLFCRIAGPHEPQALSYWAVSDVFEESFFPVHNESFHGAAHGAAGSEQQSQQQSAAIEQQPPQFCAEFRLMIVEKARRSSFCQDRLGTNARNTQQLNPKSVCAVFLRCAGMFGLINLHGAGNDPFFRSHFYIEKRRLFHQDRLGTGTAGKQSLL